MKKLNFLHLCVLFLILRTTDSTAQCNLICNGNFDAFITTSNAIVNATTVACWKTTSPDNKMEFWHNPYAGFGSASGPQFIEINAFNPATVYQDFTTVPGSILTVGYAHRGRLGVDTMKVEMGPVGGPYTSLGKWGDGSAAWVYRTSNYTVPLGLGTSYRVRFVSVYASGGDPAQGNFLDTVTVKAPPCTYSATSAVTQASCGTVNSASVVTSNTALGYTYIWSPGSYTTATISNVPSGVYHVTVTAACGCTSVPTVLTLTLNPAPASPTITISASSTLACPGSPSTLTASGAASYVWYPGYSTANPLVVSPTVPTLYYAFGTSTSGCQSFTTITIYPGNDIPLTVSDVSYCTNAATSVAITATTSYGGAVTYFWQPSFQYGQTVYVSPTSTTYYTVTATSPSACPATAVVAVNVTTNCCSQDVSSYTDLSGGIAGGYSSGSYFLGNSVTLGGSTSFQDMELVMMPGVQIIVPSGMVLDLQGAHLYACGINMWQGIVVQDGGQIITTTSKGMEGSMIEDAVIAVEVDNITSAHAAPPVLIDNVVFNKNYIGVQLSNSSGITSLPIGLSECVFASRNMPFTSTSWPTTYNTPGGLRYPYSPTATQDLYPPYLLSSYPQTNLKLPYPSQSAFIGIQIQNVGTTSGILPPAGSGVDIGYAYPAGLNQFNLFDGLTIGINLDESSLSTMNNVFQNSSIGINHTISGTMNALLNLVPTTASTDYGNGFWDCSIGVRAYNVFEVDMQYGIFRSTQKYTTPSSNIGMYLETNRWQFDIEQSQFNNVDQGILIRINNGAYNVGKKDQNGTYAGDILIQQNYFGAEVNSTNPISNEYMDYGVTLDGTNGSAWQIAGGCKIISNKLDRVFRGIQTNRTDIYPVEIGGNNIYVIDDNVLYTSLDQFGIFANLSKDNMFINMNEVRGEGTATPERWNQRLKLIRSWDNQGGGSGTSPIVTCNNTYDAYVGFEFSKPQPNTIWTGNTMFQKMYKGLELVNNGQIGTQGNPSQPCNDKWDDNGNPAPFQWIGSGNWQTFVDASSSAAPGSFLWCDMSSSLTWPTTNGGFGPPFSQPSSIDKARGDVPDCAYPVDYPETPSQRPAHVTQLTEQTNASSEITVFPNPTTGALTVSTRATGATDLRIIDVDGRLVYSKMISGDERLDISSLKSGVYFIEIKDSANKVQRKKIIRMN